MFSSEWNNGASCKIRKSGVISIAWYSFHSFHSSIHQLINSSIHQFINFIHQFISFHSFHSSIHYFCKQPVIYENHKIGDISISLFWHFLNFGELQVPLRWISIKKRSRTRDCFPSSDWMISKSVDRSLKSARALEIRGPFSIVVLIVLPCSRDKSRKCFYFFLQSINWFWNHPIRRRETVVRAT